VSPDQCAAYLFFGVAIHKIGDADKTVIVEKAGIFGLLYRDSPGRWFGIDKEETARGYANVPFGFTGVQTLERYHVPDLDVAD